MPRKKKQEVVADEVQEDGLQEQAEEVQAEEQVVYAMGEGSTPDWLPKQPKR